MRSGAQRAAVIAAWLLCTWAAAPAAAAITTANAWMRPVRAGSAAADVYLDVRTSDPLRLVSASTPWAQSVQMWSGVFVDGAYAPLPAPDGFLVDGNGTLRFARYGNALRLINVRRDALLGTTVKVTLTFRDARGERSQATANVLVRGLFNPAADVRPATR